MHGKQAFDQEVLDWRPFEYFSHRELGPFGPFLWTFELSPDGEGTALEIRVKLMGGIGQRAMMLVGRRKLRQVLDAGLENMTRLVERPA